MASNDGPGGAAGESTPPSEVPTTQMVDAVAARWAGGQRIDATDRDFAVAFLRQRVANQEAATIARSASPRPSSEGNAGANCMGAEGWIDEAGRAIGGRSPDGRAYGKEACASAAASNLFFACRGWPGSQEERDKLTEHFRAAPRDTPEAIRARREEVRDLVLRGLREPLVTYQRKRFAVLALANLYALGVGDLETIERCDALPWLLPSLREYLRDALLGPEGLGGQYAFKRSCDLEAEISQAPTPEPMPGEAAAIRAIVNPESGDRDFLAEAPHSVEAINCSDHDAASAAARDAVREHWDGLIGTLRRLNLKRGVIEGLRVPFEGAHRVTVSQLDADPAPPPSALARCAARAVEAIAALETPASSNVTVLNGIADRLGVISRIWSPWKARQRDERAKPDGSGLATSTANAARECLEWGNRCYPNSPNFGRHYLEAGLALAADLEGRTAEHHRAAVNAGLEGLLLGVAEAESVPQAYRDAARLIAEGRATPEAVLTLLDQAGTQEQEAAGTGQIEAPDPVPTPEASLRVDARLLDATDDGKALRLGGHELTYMKSDGPRRVTLNNAEGRLLLSLAKPGGVPAHVRSEAVSHLRRALEDVEGKPVLLEGTRPDLRLSSRVRFSDRLKSILKDRRRR